MQQTLSHRSDFLDIYYHPLHGYLYCNWKGRLSEAAVKAGGEKILQHLRQHQCTRVLNDNRQVKGSCRRASGWVATDLVTRLVEAGLSHLAWIVSPHPLTQVCTLITLRKATSRLAVTRTFWDESAATLWLLETP